MLRVVSVWTGKAGSPWYSTQYYAGNTQEQAAAAVAATSSLMSTLTGLLAGGITVVSEDFVASVSPTTGETTDGFTVAPYGLVNDPSSNVMVSAATQALVSLRTGIYAGGREIRGKFYIPGFLASALDSEGRFLAARAAVVNTAFSDWIAGPSTPLVWSRKVGNIFEVTSATMTTKPAVLRSRRD